MTISTFERNATIAEMAVEIDRRGAVIERLEAERDTLTAALASSTAGTKLLNGDEVGGRLVCRRCHDAFYYNRPTPPEAP